MKTTDLIEQVAAKTGIAKSAAKEAVCRHCEGGSFGNDRLFRDQ